MTALMLCVSRMAVGVRMTRLAVMPVVMVMHLNVTIAISRAVNVRNCRVTAITKAKAVVSAKSAYLTTVTAFIAASISAAIKALIRSAKANHARAINIGPSAMRINKAVRLLYAVAHTVVQHTHIKLWMSVIIAR